MNMTILQSIRKGKWQGHANCKNAVRSRCSTPTPAFATWMGLQEQGGKSEPWAPDVTLAGCHGVKLGNFATQQNAKAQRQSEAPPTVSRGQLSCMRSEERKGQPTRLTKVKALWKSGDHPFCGYEMYQRSGMAQPRIRDEAWRAHAKEKLLLDEATCLWFALVELVTEEVWDDLIAYAIRHNGVCDGWSVEEVTQMFVATDCNVSIWVTVLDDDMKLRPLNVRPGLLTRNIIMVLHNNKFQVAPHWLPAHTIGVRSRIRPTPVARQDYEQLFGMVGAAVDWPLALARLDRDLRALPPLIPELTADLVQPPIDAVVPQLFCLEGDVAVFEGLNTVVGVHAPALPVMQEHGDGFLERLRDAIFNARFYRVGEGRLVVVEADTVRGAPGAVARAFRAGVTAWEYHPDVLPHMHPESTDLLYIKDSDLVHPLHAGLLSTGCFNPTLAPELRVSGHLYRLHKVLRTQSAAGTYTFFSIEVKRTTTTGHMRRFFNESTAGLFRVRPTVREPVYSVDLDEIRMREDAFPDRRTYLQAAFQSISTEMSRCEDLKDMVPMVQTIRQNVLALESEGKLPEGYDPMATIAAARMMRSQHAEVFRLKARGPQPKCR